MKFDYYTNLFLFLKERACLHPIVLKIILLKISNNCRIVNLVSPSYPNESKKVTNLKNIKSFFSVTKLTVFSQFFILANIFFLISILIVLLLFALNITGSCWSHLVITSSDDNGKSSSICL